MSKLEFLVFQKEAAMLIEYNEQNNNRESPWNNTDIGDRC